MCYDDDDDDIDCRLHDLNSSRCFITYEKHGADRNVYLNDDYSYPVWHECLSFLFCAMYFFKSSFLWNET